MSLVADHVRRLDANIDRISLVPLTLHEQELEDHGFDGQSAQPGISATDALSSPRVGELVRIAKSLSSNSTSKSTLSSLRIQSLLIQSGLTGEQPSFHELAGRSQYETEIEWLVVGKATVQTYGLLMNTFLDQIIPLSDDIWYWDDVLGSYWSSALYTVQTSPVRMWGWSWDIYAESLERFDRLRKLRKASSADEIDDAGIGPYGSDSEQEQNQDQDTGKDHAQAQDQSSNAGHRSPLRDSLSTQWRQFYSIVRASIAERTITDLRRRVVSRVGIGRAEARRKQHDLRKLRESAATGLGILMGEGLNFGTTEDGNSGHEGKRLLERSVALMDVILRQTRVLDIDVSEYEDKVFAGVDEDPELSMRAEDSLLESERPAVLARRILKILQDGLPGYTKNITRVARENGRPSRLVRFWLPAVVLLVSSSTILRVLSNRREDIINWIRDLGTTTRDFWFNWVVGPIRKIIRTIRHDSTSEIAIMSRDSLKADRDSLERMVVEFSTDRPDIAVGTSSITENQIAEIRAKVKEGDVTPVLKAYERDLRQPFVGAVKGDLVRSLLIQVQKTKVDLEVAISGIDALLKSQELVFGFVGLTPGILEVSVGLFQYLRNVLWSRQGLRRGQKSRRTTRVLRKIDKILSDATPSPGNVISYKDYGLLLSEVHVLRRLAHDVLPSEVEKEFIEDADELAELRGINSHMRALDRIRWAYAEWLGTKA
ncbi:ATP synthase regulation protein NCA2-domain-containing protein [Podospora aff. communis PSN243]|uniref:ATP synthase regulation protein NCA2-domain-containing protein n=1 Tax=Podospora aff. communis PSN243 TaxID=3040156 RepID=A0AAV9GR33_9PEZI|nr:ATP synthase regulation protein NCA2-domain-containing protein [Podospora aff. communis PSN243]